MSDVNYSSTLPVARTKKKLCAYQTDGTNVSLEFDLDVDSATPSATGSVSLLAIETLELVTAGASDVTRTLPAVASSTDAVVVIKKIDSGAGNVIIEGNGSETVDGALNYTLSNQWQYVRLYCDGTTWHVIGNN
jgi:hypothetical protein